MDALLDGKITEDGRARAKKFMLPILARISKEDKMKIGKNDETCLLKEIYRDYLYYLTARDNNHDLTLGIDIVHAMWNYEWSYKDKIEQLNKILKGKGD
jgi:hypothetical protein